MHDSKLSIPLPLSIMFVNREVLDCSAKEEVMGKDQGLQLACYKFTDVQQFVLMQIVKVMNGIVYDQGMTYSTNIQRMRYADKN